MTSPEKPLGSKSRTRGSGRRLCTALGHSCLRVAKSTFLTTFPEPAASMGYVLHKLGAKRIHRHRSLRAGEAVSLSAGGAVSAVGIARHTAARSPLPARGECRRPRARRHRCIRQQCAGRHPPRSISLPCRHLDMQVRNNCNYGC